MTARVDPDLCVSCELCVNVCPEVFRMVDDKAVAGPVPAAAEACCRQAAEGCPTAAISLQD